MINWMLSGLSPEGFVLSEYIRTKDPKAFVRDTKSGLSPEGIRASY